MKAAVAAVVAVAACSHGPDLTTCRESIAGMWRDPHGRRWAAMEHQGRIEIYPDWGDTEPPPGTPPEIEVAPRVIDLVHAGDDVAGTIHRRFGKGADFCDVAVPIHIRNCHGSTIEIEIAEPPAPTAYKPCALPSIPYPVRETWTWERTGP